MRPYCHLSPQLQLALEKQAFSEGLLTVDNYRLNQIYDVPEFYSATKSTGKFLSYLCFEPRLLATPGDFELATLTQDAGLDLAVVDPNDIRPLYYVLGIKEDGDQRASLTKDEYLLALESANRSATSIFLANKEVIISQISGLSYVEMFDEDNRILYGDSPFLIGEGDVVSIFENQYDDIIDYLGGYFSTSLRTGALDYIYDAAYDDEDLEYIRGPLSHPYFGIMLDKLGDLYARQVAGIFVANLESHNLAARNWLWTRKKAPSTKARDILRASELLRVKFQKELTVVPAPRTIREAVDMGQSKEMKRLRQLIHKWIEEVRYDNLALESRIRKDIEKASRELKNLKKFKEYYESPVIFSVRAIAGQIPVISNVASAVDTIGGLYSRWIENRNYWIKIEEE